MFRKSFITMTTLRVRSTGVERKLWTLAVTWLSLLVLCVHQIECRVPCDFYKYHAGCDERAGLRCDIYSNECLCTSRNHVMVLDSMCLDARSFGQACQVSAQCNINLGLGCFWQDQELLDESLVMTLNYSALGPQTPVCQCRNSHFYVYTEEIQKCVTGQRLRSRCLYSAQCNFYDPQSHCESGTCQCKIGFYEDVEYTPSGSEVITYCKKIPTCPQCHFWNAEKRSCELRNVFCPFETPFGNAVESVTHEVTTVADATYTFLQNVNPLYVYAFNVVVVIVFCIALYWLVVSRKRERADLAREREVARRWSSSAAANLTPHNYTPSNILSNQPVPPPDHSPHLAPVSLISTNNHSNNGPPVVSQRSSRVPGVHHVSRIPVRLDRKTYSTSSSTESQRGGCCGASERGADENANYSTLRIGAHAGRPTRSSGILPPRENPLMDELRRSTYFQDREVV